MMADRPTELDAASTKFIIYGRESAHVDPVRHAMALLQRLHGWLGDVPSARLADPIRVLRVVDAFHPDRGLDQAHRELISVQNMSGLWLLWEQDQFKPDKDYMRPWLEAAAALEVSHLLESGATDFRIFAMIYSAQLALYEGDFLKRAPGVKWLQPKTSTVEPSLANVWHERQPSSTATPTSSQPSADAIDVAETWRHLYWFTRFHSVFERIGSSMTDGEVKTAIERATAARAWKRLAWKFYCSEISQKPNRNVKAIAGKFVELHDSPVAMKQVEIYLDMRLKLSRQTNMSADAVGRGLNNSSKLK